MTIHPNTHRPVTLAMHRGTLDYLARLGATNPALGLHRLVRHSKRDHDAPPELTRPVTTDDLSWPPPSLAWFRSARTDSPIRDRTSEELACELGWPLPGDRVRYWSLRGGAPEVRPDGYQCEGTLHALYAPSGCDEVFVYVREDGGLIHAGFIEQIKRVPSREVGYGR